MTTSLRMRTSTKEYRWVWPTMRQSRKLKPWKLIQEPSFHLSWNIISLKITSHSGKLSREKTLANFVYLGPFVKVFFTKRGEAIVSFITHANTVEHVHRLWVCLAQYPVCGESTKVFSSKSYISSIRESFNSPSEVSCYAVLYTRMCLQWWIQDFIKGSSGKSIRAWNF